MTICVKNFQRNFETIGFFFDQHDHRREREQRDNMMKKRNLGEEECLCLCVCLFVSKSGLERTGGTPVFIHKRRNFHGLEWH